MSKHATISPEEAADRLAIREPANFSRAVPEHAENLAVLPVGGTGWSDWGTPERIFQSLKMNSAESGSAMQGARA